MRFAYRTLQFLPFLYLVPLLANAADLLGTPPAYTTRALTPFPNEHAVLTRIWSPGLEQGFVPQGLTWAAAVIEW